MKRSLCITGISMCILMMCSALKAEGQCDTAFIINKINIQGKQYLYRNSLLTDKEMYALLLTNPDVGIKKAIRKSKRFKAFENTAFAIGITASGLALITSSYAHMLSDMGFKSRTQKLEKAASFSFYTGAGLIVCGDIFKGYKRKNNKKAIHIYNQKF